MKPIAILGAFATAVLGATGWALISWKSGYEFGFLAMAVGGLVGLAAVRLGGWGRPMAVVCALLATLAIFAGRIAAVYFASRDAYADLLVSASDFAKVQGEEEYAAFMVKHRITEAKQSTDVGRDELDFFKTNAVPYLKAVHEHPPSFEEWRAEHFQGNQAGLGSIGLLVHDALRSLNILDAAFALLGIATAFRLVMAAQPRETFRSAGPGHAPTHDAGPVA